MTLTLKVKVKFDITKSFLRCGFLLTFNTLHMSIMLYKVLHAYVAVFNAFPL